MAGCLGFFATAFAAPVVQPIAIALPGVSAHAGFDDMGFLKALGRVVIPGGDSGELFLINPKTGMIKNEARITPPGHPKGRHDVGTTSVAYGDGYLLASDHNNQSVAIVDPKSGKVVNRVPLASGPDYVRFIAPVDQLWVTEPEARQIEIFKSELKGPHPTLKHVGQIHIKGGPESLVYDATTGMAYTNLWKRKTLAINIKTRKVVHAWTDGCRGPRGLALSKAHDLLFVGCTEGKADALSLKTGKVLSSVPTGRGVDIIAWNAHLQHLYVPAARSATLTIIGLNHDGQLEKLKTLKAAHGSHCVATDEKNMIYVCDPLHGYVLSYKDIY